MQADKIVQGILANLPLAVGVGIAYAVTGYLGFSMAISPGNVTAIWPPSGIAVAAVLIYGRRAAAGIWLGSFALNSVYYSHETDLLTGLSSALAIAGGSTLQALAAGKLLSKKLDRSNILGRPQDAMIFICLSALSCVIAASIGVLSICLAQFSSWAQFGRIWLTWWAGDLGGMIVYTPLVLTWKSLPEFCQSRRRAAEFAVFLLILCGVSLLLFGNSYVGRHHYPLLFLAFPFLLVAAWRFGVCGVTLTIPIVEIFVIEGMKRGQGSFMSVPFDQSLFLLAGFMGVFSCIGLTYASVLTEWQTLRKKLENTAQELEAKVAERTSELEEANRKLLLARDQALEASNAKSAFIANMSHELRTPLGGILGMCELILASPLIEGLREKVEVVFDSGKVLLAVVNDILDFATIEAGKIKLQSEPFNPSMLVQDCVKLMAPQAATRDLRLNVSLDSRLPLFVRGDAARIQQTLLNLIGNAVKFTESGSVTVSCELESRNEESQENDDSICIRFSVADTGIGIEPRHQELLFKPFSQVETGNTRKFGGTGLGLAISKRFVEMMQGRIACESIPGKGSVFWFCLPFQQSANNEPGNQGNRNLLPAHTLPDTLTKGKSILVVEDNAVMRKVVKLQLAQLQLDSTGVATGSAAIAEFKSGNHDLILLDIQLPDISGYEVARAIRTLEASRGLAQAKGIPIIALTAGAMLGAREAALNAGIDDYLAKPAGIEQLSKLLEQWLACPRSVF